MAHSTRQKLHLQLPALGLVLQLFAIVLLPLTILLVAITFGSISIHQQAMRNMVGERDARAVRTAAGALSAQIDNRARELKVIAGSLSTDPSAALTPALEQFGSLVPDFDAGVAIYSAQGLLLSKFGNQPTWDQWAADQAGWNSVFSEVSAKTGELVVAPLPVSGTQLGLLSSQAGDNLLIGAFSVFNLARTTLEEILPSEGQLSILLVGSDQTILYNAGHLSDQSADHPGVAEALQGSSGTVYVKVPGDEHVTAYSPVTAAGWALVTEESWEAASTPTLRASQIAPLVLVPAVLVMVLALWFGASQVVKPLHTLESKSARLAVGDFGPIREPVGGIAEIQSLQKELVLMANKVQEAERTLHGYIGAITAAQEDERRRLARELHDETLQALIALKQRVQLAQLELQAAGGQTGNDITELGEIASLTEHTIDNLRRMTRALRPAYLEDLGLVPSLEMLAREAGKAMGVTVDFQRQGIEKRLDASIELTLYRIAQEALSNVARHAHARRAALVISYTENEVVLRVVDDGVGFVLPGNPSEYTARGHYGLLGLKERADLIGAILVIQSTPGQGTRLTVTLPVKL